MKKSEIELSFRRAFQDLEEDYLISQDEFTQFLNEAEEEACRRARLLVSTDLSTGETKANSTITITGNSGSINSVLINNINIISEVIDFTGSIFTTANVLSNAINTLGLFTAIVNSNSVIINPLDGVGDELNNIIPIVMGDLVTTTTAFSGGINGICKLSIKPNQSTYPISTKVIKRNAYYYGSDKRKMEVVDYREMDSCFGLWQKHTGTPCKVVHGLNSNKITLYKIPKVKDTILMNVTHLPVKQILLDDDEPSIPEQWHKKLISWVLYRSYSKNDSEIQNTSSARYFKELFDKDFGEDETTNALQEQARRIFADSYGDY